MNKLILISVIILTVFSVSCKQESKAPDGYKIYSSDSLGFDIEYPIGFEAKEYFNQFIPISFFEVIKDSSTDLYPENVLVNIEKIPVKVPFSDFLQASKTQLKLMIPELTIYDEDSLQIDGAQVGVYKFYRPKKDSLNFVSKMYVVYQNDRAINFSCTGAEQVFDAYESIFDRLVQSTKFKKK